MIQYHVHGLSVKSQLPLPPLVGSEKPSNASPKAEIQISAGQVPRALQAPEVDRQRYQAAPGEALIHAPGVGRLHVVGGHHIAYELTAPDQEATLAAYVLGSGFAILHQQRGNVVLHGATVCRDGKVFLICGCSGAGKSTLAARLLEQGGQTLGDDVCFIGEGPDFLVHPGPPSTKLADDALASLANAETLSRQGTCPSGKGIYDTSTRFLNEPRPLAGIIMLEPDDAADVIVTKQLSGAEAQLGLHYNTFRKRCITSDTAQELFTKRSALAQAIPIWRISRPTGADTREEIVKLAGELIMR